MGGAAASPDDLNPKPISWRGGRASQSKARAIVSTAQMLFQCNALERSQFSSLLSRRGTGPRFDKFARLIFQTVSKHRYCLTTTGFMILAQQIECHVLREVPTSVS